MSKDDPGGRKHGRGKGVLLKSMHIKYNNVRPCVNSGVWSWGIELSDKELC